MMGRGASRAVPPRLEARQVVFSSSSPPLPSPPSSPFPLVFPHGRKGVSERVHASATRASWRHTPPVRWARVTGPGVWTGRPSKGPSAFCRVALGASFRGSGASVTARGLVVSGGPSPSTVGIHTAFRHLVEGCTSDQVQKILVADKGKGCFRGLIRANGEALQTKADQLCRSMLLTDGAKVHVAPCLEIIADDVECTHGATVADLDEEKVFYFRARGISAEAARAAMVRGFATDVLGDVPSEVGPCVPGRSRAAAHRVP